MGLVHSLVAEILAHFIYAFKTAYYETLEVQLSSDTHVHILIEGIEMRDERTGRCSAGNVLQDRSIYFRISCIVEDRAHRAYDGSPFEESFLYSVIHYEVHIALAVAQFRVVEFVVSHAVLIFHDRQWLE